MGATTPPRGRRVPWRLALLTLATPTMAAATGCLPTESPEPPAVVRYEAAAQRLEAALDQALVGRDGPDCAAACNRLRELAARTEELCVTLAPAASDGDPCTDARDRLRNRRQEAAHHCVCLR